MDDRIVSTAVLTLSRQQEEFLARYRTHESQKAYFDSYGLGVTPFFRGGGGSHVIIPPSPVLPYDYEVEYLEMNDAENLCYLDLGIVLDENIYDVQCEFTLLGYPNFNAYSGWFGCWNSTPNYSIGASKWWVNNNVASFLVAASSFDRSKNLDVSYNSKYDILLHKSGQIYVNGNLIGTSGLAHKNNGTNTFKIFRNDNANPDYVNYTFGRIHLIKIWRYDILIYDFIPVSKGGIGYMYDKISGNLFGEQVGGSLVVGPRKE